MKPFPYHEYIFSPRYRVWRHVIYWSLDLAIWAGFWTLTQYTYGRNLYHMLVWLPVFMLYSYPLAYWIVPRILMRGRYLMFTGILLLWGIAGWYINIYYRIYVFFPAQEAMGFGNIIKFGPMPGSYLCLTTTTGGILFFTILKQWIKKQQEWMQTEKEKVTAELQLLKAQVHPHFLFNTLNNIYAFSLENSPKTPGLILKLSSLLSYMLYDCKSEEVMLEKETEIMKNYIDLEKERYGNKIEISWNVEGNLKDKFIAPLILLPFLENAFKHGTSEQIDNPWMSVNISANKDTLKYKVVNSKNEFVPYSQNGIGVDNVKKRLALIYPGMHDLKMSDEGNFYVVSLLIRLKNYGIQESATRQLKPEFAEKTQV